YDLWRAATGLRPKKVDDFRTRQGRAVVLSDAQWKFEGRRTRGWSMATTIDEAFRKLRTNLEITGLQESTVSTRQQRIRGLLEADFTVLDSFLGGSYRRSTMIAPLGEADIDIFIVL